MMARRRLRSVNKAFTIKRLLLIALALGLIAAGVFGVKAYLSSRSSFGTQTALPFYSEAVYACSNGVFYYVEGGKLHCYDPKNPDGIKAVWVADSGFDPFGYWMSFDQLATLIPPKGYAYSTATPVKKTTADNIAEGMFMSLSKERQEDLANKIDKIYHELVYKFQSRYEKDGVQSNYRDTLVGYGLENDRKVEDIHVNMLPEIYRILLNVQEQTSDRKGK